MDADYTLVKIDAMALASRVIDIIITRDMAAVSKAMEKLSLRSTAMDVEPDEKALRRQMDKDMDERVARAVQSALAKKSKYPDLSSDSEEENNLDNCNRKQGQKRSRAEKRAEGQRAQKRQRTETSRVAGHGKGREEKAQEGQKRKETSESLILFSNRFNYRKASTYPDKPSYIASLHRGGAR
jgi:flagellar biosynthesis/type III secretory pathway protein FliH